MKNDAFADIAASYAPGRERGLVRPEPLKVLEKTVRLLTGAEKSFKLEERMDGPEAVLARLEELRGQYADFLRDLAPLPPRTGFHADITRFMFSLDGGAAEEVRIPHYCGPTGEHRAVYSTEFILPEWDEKCVVLSFKGVDYIAEVFVNGIAAGRHEGFFSPFELDVTAAAVPGSNVLNVHVINKEKMQFGGDKIYAATGLGWDDPLVGWHHCPGGMGIYNSVYVEIREKTHITDLFPRVNDGAEELWVECTSALPEDADVAFSVSVYGQNFPHTEYENEMVVPFTRTACGLNDTFTEAQLRARGQLGKITPLRLGSGFNRFILPLHIREKRLWEPDTPYLYKVIVTMLVGGQAVSVFARQFGIRTFTQSLTSEPKGKFYLNGREIRLYGANTMGFEQQDVFRGDVAQLVDDLLLAKTANMNFLRITQRPVQEEIYDFCDRVGLMVQTDFPTFGCIRINQYCEVLRQCEEMERLVRSHPCCILDTYINEPFPNANNQPHRMLTRPELRRLFDAMDGIVLTHNPDRVIKHVDGDYDPPGTTLPDNHCYSMWYNGHGMDMGMLHKGYWLDVKPGWHYGCGEFGAEGLDNREIMEKYYPPGWLAEPFTPANIVGAQSAAFHLMFYETPASMDEWITASQRHQAFAARIMTSAMRRNPNMNTFAIHLFIDAFPSGWMKAIMDCDRVPKQAFYEYADCLSPVCCSLRSDRFTFFENEEIILEAYLCNDIAAPVDELRFMAMMGDRVLYSAAARPSDGEVSQGRIVLRAPGVSDRAGLRVIMAAFSGGRLLHYTCEVYGIFPLESAVIPHIVPYSDFLSHRAGYEEAVKNGAHLIIGGPDCGKHTIAGKTVTVRACAMGPVYFVSRDTGHPVVEGLLPNDLSYFYDNNLDRIAPIAYTTFTGDGVIPVVTGGNRDEAGCWESQLVCGEWRYGAGRIMVCQMALEGKEKNPCAVHLLNGLSRFAAMSEHAGSGILDFQLAKS